jgi:hypothetical protein
LADTGPARKSQAGFLNYSKAGSRRIAIYVTDFVRLKAGFRNRDHDFLQGITPFMIIPRL